MIPYEILKEHDGLRLFIEALYQLTLALYPYIKRVFQFARDHALTFIHSIFWHLKTINTNEAISKHSQRCLR